MIIRKTHGGENPMEKKIGQYAFILGVVLAIVLGLFSGFIPADATPWLVSVLILAGLVVGFLNVTGKDTKEFILVATALVIVSFAMSQGTQYLSQVEIIGSYLQDIFNSIMAFVVPATIVIGLKDIWSLGKVD